MKWIVVLKHYVTLLAAFTLFSGCGEAVKNLEERARIEAAKKTNPVIYSSLPYYAPTAGGEVLTITGERLHDVLSAYVNGAVCPIVTQSFATLTCTSPVLSAGIWDIRVVNSRGESGELSSGVQYLNAPVITSVTPAVGSVNGGDLITISGTDFFQVQRVDLGAQTCVNLTQVNSTTLTCETPADVVGQVDVIVVNVDGQDDTQTNGFEYSTPPSITSFNPTSLFEAGGQTLQITGTDFDAGATVTVDGSACAVTLVTVPTLIECTTPAGSGSAQTVRVANSDGVSDTQPIDYDPAPILTSIDLSKGVLAGGDVVTLTGDHFLAGGSFAISLAGVACASVNVVDAQTATCTSDASGAVVGDVVLTNNDGQSATLSSAFEYRGPPTVSSITPNAGSVAGGQSVTINGAGFDLANLSVSIGGTACSSITIVNSGELTCTTGAHAQGTVDVDVTNTEDNQTASLVSGYTYNIAPVIASLDLNYGPLAGGNSITINGSGFQAGADALVAGVSCTTTTVVNATEITCVVPGGTGLANVSVDNPDGQSVTLSSSYTYSAGPTLSSISPEAGPINGGQTITLTGSGFMPNPDVEINSVACASVNYIDSTSIECVTYDNTVAGGPFDVSVINEDTQSSTLVGAYSFIAAPTVASVSPAFGDVNGGTTISVIGTNFETSAGISVEIDSVACAPITNLTATGFDCVIGAHASATGLSIDVTNLIDGQTGSGASFDYVGPPTITDIQEAGGGVSLDGGPVGGGNTLRIVGTDFQAGLTVSFGTFDCVDGADLTFVDANNLDCAIPAAAYTAQTVDVTVTNLDGQNTTLASAYTFRAAPSIASITPAFAPAAGGNIVRVAGSDFLASAIVAIDGADCVSTTFIDDANLDCEVPAHALATGLDVEVRHPTDLQSATSVAAFDYVAAPSIASFSPTTLYAVGGQTLTITGSDFLAGVDVTIDGAACSNINLVDPNTIECDPDPHAAGSVNVVVTNSDGQQDTASIDYVDAATLSGLDLAFGDVLGGTTIELIGTGFINDVALDVTVDGAACAPTTYVSATSITCVTPAGSLGAVDVELTNGDGQVTTLVGGFEYVSAPTISSFNPVTIYEAGNQNLVITGTGFRTGATVTIDSNPCDPITVNSATEIECTTPAGTGTGVAVEVTNLDAQMGTSSIDYQASPTISSVTGPNEADGGIEAGGETITIVGTNFMAGAPLAVSIHGVDCPITLQNATTIECTSAGGSGSGNVELTNGDSQQVVYGTPFVYYPAPAIASVSPDGGTTAGGNSITISGTGFRGGVGDVTVDLGGVACAPSSVTATDITCAITAGAHPAGSVDVTVTSSIDSQTDTLVGGYSFNAAPTISSVTPANVPQSISTSISIAGSDFISGATVEVDGVACSNIVFVNATEITCDTPVSASSGLVNVEVVNPDTQSDSDASLLTYDLAPTISSIDISQGSINGGDTITITGTDFVSLPSVSIGGVACASVTFNSATEVECVTPARAQGTYDLTLENPDGQSDTLAASYTFNPAPTIASVSPDIGDAAGATSIVITGTNLDASGVTIGGAACNITSQTATQIECDTTAAATGLASVVVTNNDAQTATLNPGFEYVDTPTFTSVTPNTGLIDGGETITIQGTNFSTQISVTLGASACGSINLVSATELTCETPAHASGAVDLILTNPVVAAHTEVGAYTYEDPAPIITSISPQGGPIAGGTLVTITGENFLTGATVTIGNACTVQTLSSTEITCLTTNNGSQGAENVVVTNPDAKTDTLSFGFIFSDTPEINYISPVNGPIAGGTVITVSGDHFQNGLVTVRIGSLSCSGVTFVDAQTLTCTAPAQAQGSYDVSVTQLSQSASLAAGYEYLDGAVLAWDLSGAIDNPEDWGSVSVNTSRVFTLENIGTADSTTVALSITGTNAGAWSIGSDDCSGMTLAIGETCNVTLNFIAGLLPTGSYEAQFEAQATEGGSAINQVLGAVP